MYNKTNLEEEEKMRWIIIFLPEDNSAGVVPIILILIVILLPVFWLLYLFGVIDDKDSLRQIDQAAHEARIAALPSNLDLKVFEPWEVKPQEYDVLFSFRNRDIEPHTVSMRMVVSVTCGQDASATTESRSFITNTDRVEPGFEIVRWARQYNQEQDTLSVWCSGNKPWAQGSWPGLPPSKVEFRIGCIESISYTDKPEIPPGDQELVYEKPLAVGLYPSC